MRAGLAVCALFVGTTATAQGSNKLSEGEQKIRAALAQKAAFDFRGVELNKAIEQIAEKHKIPIKPDRIAFDEASITGKESITFKVSGIKLESALNLLLKDLELTFAVKNEVLMITTDQAAEDFRRYGSARTYDLSAFSQRGDDGRSYVDYSQISQLVQTQTSAVNWEADGGEARIAIVDVPPLHAICVRQTWKVHREIERILDDLRALKKNAKPQTTPDNPVSKTRKRSIGKLKKSESVTIYDDASLRTVSQLRFEIRGNKLRVYRQGWQDTLNTAPSVRGKATLVKSMEITAKDRARFDADLDVLRVFRNRPRELNQGFGLGGGWGRTLTFVWRDKGKPVHSETFYVELLGAENQDLRRGILLNGRRLRAILPDDLLPPEPNSPPIGTPLFGQPGLPNNGGGFFRIES